MLWSQRPESNRSLPITNRLIYQLSYTGISQPPRDSLPSARLRGRQVPLSDCRVIGQNVSLSPPIVVSNLPDSLHHARRLRPGRAVPLHVADGADGVREPVHVDVILARDRIVREAALDGALAPGF